MWRPARWLYLESVARARAYRPRDPERGVLHAVVRAHLETFLREAAHRAGGAGLPQFVEQEFRQFLTCGVLAHGFARLRCDACAFERLVPFSCKGRGFCPSCGGRRMTERAARLVDGVLPHVPVRQWVLSLPHRLRYLLAWNHRLCRAVLGVFIRALLDFYRRRARRGSVGDGQTGTLTVIQRFGGGLNLTSTSTRSLSGVFSEDATRGLRFHPAPPPSDDEVARLLATIRRRILRLLRRRGLASDEDVPPPDPLAEESLALAGIGAASVLGRIALGRRAGARVWRLGQDPEAAGVASTGPRQAHLDGFDLHANVWVPATNRARLEELCRYLLRPPLAQERLRLTGEGRIRLRLKTPWADGTRHLLFEPLEFLEKLAALIPRSRVNLFLYHGVLAAHARWRPRVVLAQPADPAMPGLAGTPDVSGVSPPAPQARPRHWAWAQLMERAFGVDVLACPRCAGRLRLVATVEDPQVIWAILESVARADQASPPAPP